MFWLKKNWLYIVLSCMVALLTLSLFGGQSFYNELVNDKNEQIQRHLKEIKDLNAVNKKKDEDLRKIKSDYEASVRELKKAYEDKLDEIKKKQVKKRQKIIYDAYRDPNTLTKKVEKIFGIPYYKEDKK